MMLKYDYVVQRQFHKTIRYEKGSHDALPKQTIGIVLCNLLPHMLTARSPQISNNRTSAAGATRICSRQSKDA